jgi:hypothetical protein
MTSRPSHPPPKEHALRDDIIEHFIDEGLIEAVIRPLKHGKEAF